MADAMHDGHRQRMKDRFLNSGLHNFQPHEVLELLLFYAIPRRAKMYFHRFFQYYCLETNGIAE